MHVTRGLQPSMKLGRYGAFDTAWRWIAKATANPDLLAVVLFCIIGLGLTITVLLRHPDLALAVEQLDMFP
jgi:hypothetical protein